MSDHVHPSVPDELYISVFTGQLDEDEAIARGLLAAAATDSAERREVLFGAWDPPRRPPCRPCGPLPWFEP